MDSDKDEDSAKFQRLTINKCEEPKREATRTGKQHSVKLKKSVKPAEKADCKSLDDYFAGLAKDIKQQN